ncbi:putative ATP-dependent RNA helicase TDRD12 isoform X1 [Neodiprion pinetum]|uniref:putative ATP-dependent RNA helicase TDRD12 isoform X1 n=1 Tax=Neodiprion pinetum TaxID=441929 RepID=UPI001EDF81F1|nr:putative ATP-dependent RNA helicase TDRD12 isoform X1 [Neodiprion pinetum]
MEDSIYIPNTAESVKVTNVIDPFHIRIRRTENYATEIVRLEGELHRIAKTNLQKYGDHLHPQIGDMVIIDNRSSFNAELPGWCCRGIVGLFNTINTKYRVFLPDHGIALEFWMEDLKILPPFSISDDFLTSSIGIHDILPITTGDESACISEFWSNSAIRFTKEILSASTQTYFDYLSFDKSGNKFGELYLIVDNEIIVLSEALIYNQFATAINSSLIEIIENTDISSRVSVENSPIKTTKETTLELSRKNLDTTDYNKGRNKNNAVYAHAFNGSPKGNSCVNSSHEILVCSKLLCEQLNSVAEAGFPEKIHKTLRSMTLVRPMRLQGYVWPAICKGLNVVAVNSPRSGKTLSYLIPITSLVAANEIYPKFSSGVNGPLVIILCVSSTDVFHVHEKCKQILKEYPKIRILTAFNGMPEKNLMMKLYNGCEILISTPPCLKRLIKNNRKLLNLNRLFHMIFDGADVILDKYRKSLGEIFRVIKEVQHGHCKLPGSMPLQLITIAQHWTPLMRNFVDAFIKDPYVCIGSYMEAVVYASFKTKLYINPKQEKAAKVVELLGSQWSMLKTVIVCTTPHEARELSEFLKSASIDTLIAHDEMIFTDIRGIRESWMVKVSGMYSVLVCTDQVLSDLNIRDAELLIHYSLASNTKTQFFYRFSTLANNFSPQTRGKDRPKPRFIMIADESNDTQLYGIITIMRRLKTKIRPEMKAYFEKIFISTEMAKTDRQLCENLKAFGCCPYRDACTSRHCIIPEIDQPSTQIKTGDYVKFVITSIHSANHYSARVVEYTRANTNEKVTFSFEELAKLSVELQNHYADPTRRRSARTVSVGHICAVEEAPGNYKRVKVLSLVDKESSNIQDVEVRCIDDGDISFVKISQLLEVPDELAEWPSHFVDIYLTGIIPFDEEPTWSPCADRMAYTWLHETVTHSTSSVFGKVLLHLSHILWIDPLEVRDKLANGYPDLIDASLKNTLISNKCAMKNEEHIKNLLALCRTSEVSN